MALQMSMNEGADHWRNIVGVNVIPANTKVKGTFTEWKQYQDKPISQEQHDQWKKENAFKNGLAVICGKVWHNAEKEGLYLCSVDCDNQKAMDEMMPKGVIEYAKQTLVEMHPDNSNKCHFYCYTMKPVPKKSSDVTNKEMKKKIDANQIPALEVKGDGAHGIMFASPSVHKNGTRYEILDCKIPMLLDPIVQVIEEICTSYGINYLKNVINNNSLIPMAEIVSDDAEIIEGHNRHLAMLRYTSSVYAKALPNTTDKIILEMLLAKNNIMCKPPLDESEIIKLQEQSKEQVKEWKKEEKNQTTSEISIKTELKTNWEIVKDPKSDDDVKAKAKNEINRLRGELGDESIDWNATFKKPVDLIDKTAGKIIKEFDLVTNRQNKEIMMHTGKIYRQDSATKSILEERTEQIIDYCTTHERNEVINKLKALTGADLDAFDSDPNILCLDNGLLDIQELEVKPHTPKHLSTVLIPVEYHKPQFEINDETIFEDIEKNLKDTLFWKFLKSSFTINGIFRREDFESVLEIVASFFVKKIIDEKAFMFLGRGENGKSVLTEYIINMLGASNVEKIPLQALSDDKFMGAKLVGKMANIYSDLNDGSFNDTSFIKNGTSGEGIEVQHKHQHPFILVPFCNFLFSCNRFPKVKDQTHGFFRRWMIVKWRRNFENDPERDEHLKDKLRDNQEEKSLVFSSLIHLSRLLLKNGKFSHSKDSKVTQKEWNTNSDPLNDFVETCIVDSEKNKSVRKTYSFYRQMMEARQETPLSMAQFSRGFKEYFDQQITKEDGKSERVWLYIDFVIPKINEYDAE